MNQDNFSQPRSFKGIALFTPGGDLVYCIDPDKQSQWHLHLCTVLQEMLGLLEPPHFLVPCYTATVDQWIDPRNQQLQTLAEAYPLVRRHQALLNAVFNIGDMTWQVITQTPELCAPMVLSTYRQQFPQLWEDHDLIVRLDKMGAIGKAQLQQQWLPSWAPLAPTAETRGYVLRLFVSGHSTATKRILQNLHQLLEQSLQHPYTLKIVDIYKHPEQAEANQISATPTLVKLWPEPVKRIVGDLDNMGKVLQVLVSEASGSKLY
ncbi:MAG: circadian clock protein KaiB [Cyanothece sp. SIO1E1]|nr:circadian clock protein KaiB [Cyanothece sp. SIO1E1]